MFKNYIKIAFRNILKYRGYSLINIMGLAVGIACCIMILLYVQDELSFDRYNEKADRIYRVTLSGKLGENEINSPLASPPLAETLVREYPEVEEVARIVNFGFPVIRYKDNVFSEEHFFWVDSTFFDVFTVKFLRGNSDNALDEPGAVVITESMAKKYFGNEDPLGKLLNSDNRRDYKVTGVISDFPDASHFHFDFLASLSSYEVSRSTNWLANFMYTYILLKKGTGATDFQEKLDAVVKKYSVPAIEQATGASFESLTKSGGRYEYKLQALTDIHLKSDLEREFEPNSSMSYVYIFSAIAISILFIACINFMNLTTARSSNRSKEIGVRKTLGSYRGQLIKQFLVETTLMSVLGIVLSLIMIEVLLPFFNNLVEKDLSLNYFQNIYTIPALVTLALVVGLLAGTYPAFYLSAFNPVKVLKKNSVKGGKSVLRNSLVVAQFAISIILIIGTFIIYNQLEFIRNKKLGYNKEQIIVIQKTDDIAANKGAFMEQLRSTSGIINASNSVNIFGESFFNSTFKVVGSDQHNNIAWQHFTDENLADTYQIPMAQGRFFSKEFRSDTLSVVINETAAKMMGIKDDPIGKVIYNLGQPEIKRQVVGVMKDFHFESLHQSIKPLVLTLIQQGFGRFVSVRLAPGDFREKIDDIKEIWHRYAGEQAFEYFFFDEEFGKIYRAEETTGIIASVFSVLAIIIACLGLLGLASFTTEQRTKEVGIRKILGATAGGIVLLLSKDFVKWVVIANLIAWPAAYFVMTSWLEDFAYRIDIPLWTFLTAGIAAMVIAFLTVSYQAFKAAIANPVKSLKYE